jgi:hypothetical protein
MAGDTDPRLIAFCGSETRVLTLGVLANSKGPMTGYRVAKVAGVQPIKVYRELDRAVESGLVERSSRGYQLVDPDLIRLLQKRFRVTWSGSWFADEKAREARARRAGLTTDNWFDPSRYRRNPSVAKHFATEIERPSEKDSSDAMGTEVISRKRK